MIKSNCILTGSVWSPKLSTFEHEQCSNVSPWHAENFSGNETKTLCFGIDLKQGLPTTLCENMVVNQSNLSVNFLQITFTTYYLNILNVMYIFDFIVYDNCIINIACMIHSVVSDSTMWHFAHLCWLWGILSVKYSFIIQRLQQSELWHR